MKEDWVRIIETAYDLVDDDGKWLAAVGEAVRPALDRGFGVVGYFFDASTNRLSTSGYIGIGAAPEHIEFARRTHDVAAWQSPELVRVTYRSGSALRYSTEMGGQLSPATAGRHPSTVSREPRPPGSDSQRQ